VITGMVTAGREAVVQLRLRGTNGIEVDVEAVIDTGFTESLAVSQMLVGTLALAFVETNKLFLADGSPITVDLYECMVTWDGQDRAVIAHCVQGRPLIGMSLLYDHLLTVRVQDGGPVTIAAVP
jgi:clan AA aspartic protease